MANQVNSSLFYSSSNQHSLGLKITILVILIHLGILGIGIFWEPASALSKPHSKMMIQTVQLKSFQASTIQNLSSPSLKDPSLVASEEEPSKPTQLAQLVEPNLPIEKEIIPKQENFKKLEEDPIPLLKQDDPPPSIPIKAEKPSPPKITSPKSSTQEMKKVTPIKKITPAKQQNESVKKLTKDETASKKESIKSTDEVEKKGQREKIEAEKRRQQEQEAERKRQQELAAAQEAARKKELSLLMKAKENLAKMGETRDKISTSSSSSLQVAQLKEVGTLQVDALAIKEMEGAKEWGTKERTYSDEIASLFKIALKLPDYGAVTIKLTLNRTGKVVKIETLQSESTKNKSYVENKISLLQFPSFGQRFQGVSENTFVITLQNDS